jgi:hypothetical protein
MTDTPRTEAAKLEVLQVGRPARVNASFAEELERENQLLREELEQQAICNGAGASRELSLRATIDALQKELCVLRERIVKEGYIVNNFDGTIELAIDPWHKREKEVKP